MEKHTEEEIARACTIALVKMLASRSKIARESYLAAAQLFALAWQKAE